MKIREMPPWAKRLGGAGILLFTGWVLFWKLIDAVIESEAQGAWTHQIKPFLISSHTISISLTGWQISLVFSGLTAAVVLLRFYLAKKSRRNPSLDHRLKPPNWDLTNGGNIVVIRAFREVKEGRLPVEDFAQIVQENVNAGQLPIETAIELLRYFDYELAFNFDRTYRAQKRRRK